MIKIVYLDMKLIVCAIAALYIYARKHLKVFLYIAIALAIYEAITLCYGIKGGRSSILLAVLLCIVFAAGWKEIFEYDRQGISANQLMKPDGFDAAFFVVAALLLLLLRVFIF